MGPMQISEILATIPHRYPLLLVDRVEEIIVGERIVAYKNVTANEPVFQGHFPGNPIMPGVLILESLAQAMAVLAFKSMEALGRHRTENSVFYFAGIDGARFKRPVLPGDCLRLEVQMLRQKAQIWKASARATVGGELACEAELLASYKE